jgi:hypothetical protein
MSKVPEQLVSLISSFTAILKQHGFESRGLRRSQQARWIYWERASGWKVEILSLSWAEEVVDEIILHMQIDAECGDERLCIDGTTVGYQVKGTSGTYRLPSGVSRLLGGDIRFRRTLLRDIRAGLHWFNQFRAPSQVIEYLEAGRGNCPRPGSPTSRQLIGYLRMQV